LGVDPAIKQKTKKIFFMKKNRILIYPLIMMGALLMFTSSCKKDESSSSQVPILTTNAATDITTTTATSGGNITSDGGLRVTSRGVCWSTGQTPTTADSKTTDGTGAGNFSSALTGLSHSTTYYVRAYATTNAGTGYGSAMSFTTPVIVTDIDGNIYNTVAIGTQVWMVENLKTTKYRNGDPIPNVTENIEWSNLTTGAYCDYDNTPGNSVTYGKLYNWFAVNDSRNIAPTGWHVPSDAEWTILTSFLGGEEVAGGKLKETGTTHWQSPNTGATNESGFSGLPGGDNRFGSFSSLGDFGCFWSSTELGPTAWFHFLSYNDASVPRSNETKSIGFSVRCLRD
jgi:uncharacterized protein (TIGR02145 family)